MNTHQHSENSQGEKHQNEKSVRQKRTDAREADLRRFWSKVNKRDPDECWEWKAGLDGSGYGAFWLRGRQIGAHRFSFILANENIPDDMLVCHKCDNPLCCNPLHLWQGTHADNQLDKKLKGRGAIGDKNGSVTHPESRQKCENHANSKFTNMLAIQIRERGHKEPHRKLAKEFSVSKSTISRLVRGDTWKSLSGEVCGMEEGK
jgi:hypothetical protein